MFRFHNNPKPSHQIYANQNTYSTYHAIGYNKETKEHTNTIVFDVHMLKKAYTGLKFILELFGDYYWEFNDGMARYVITIEYKIDKMVYTMVECIYNGFKTRAPFIFSFEDMGNATVKLRITHVLCLITSEYYGYITYNFISYKNNPFLCEDIKYINVYNEEHIEMLPYKMNPDVGESTRFEYSVTSNKYYGSFSLLETANNILVSSYINNLTDKYSVRIFKGYEGIRILYNTSTNDIVSEAEVLSYEDYTKVLWFGHNRFKQEQPLIAKSIHTNGNFSIYKYPTELSAIRYSIEVNLVYDGEDDFYYYFHFKNLSVDHPDAIDDDTAVIFGLKHSECKNIVKPSIASLASLIPEKKLQNNLQNNQHKIYKLCNSKHNFYSSFLYKLRGVDKYVYNVA